MKSSFKAALACASCAGATLLVGGENLRLAFDRAANPLPPFQLTAETAPAGTRISVPDSVRLCEGLAGQGLFLKDSCDFMEIEGPTILSPAAGAISFWIKFQQDKSAPDRGLLLFEAVFDRGKIVVSDQLKISVLDKDGQWFYSPWGACCPKEKLKPGEWLFIVINWDAAKGTKQLFVNGHGYQLSPYRPPEGKLTKLFFALAASNKKGNPVSCAYDEICAYDQPIEPAEALETWNRRKKNDGGPKLLCPANLLAGKEVGFNPKPNYQWQGGPGTPTISCNTDSDSKKLTDNIYGAAYCYSADTVGWMSSPSVKIDFDLGEIKKIDLIGINIGLGGVRPPAKITFYCGLSPDKLAPVKAIIVGDDYLCRNKDWAHSRLISASGLNKWGRFIMIEISGGTIFCDEVFVIGNNKTALERNNEKM